MEEPEHRNAQGKLALDLGVALALLAGTVALTAGLGTMVARLERPRNVLIERIPFGTTNAYFLQQTSCFGDVSTELESHQNPILRARATVRTRLHGRTSDVTGRLFAQFNPLGQLVRGEATVAAPDITGTLTVTGVTPLKLAVAATIAGRAVSRELTVPGPIALIKNDHMSARMEYAGLPFGSDNPTTQLVRRLIDGELTIVPQTAPPAACDAAAGGRFDLGELTAKLAPFIGALTTHGGKL